MAKPTTLNLSTPIAASADKFAKEEARHNTLGFEASKAEGGAPAEATVTLGTAGSTKWFDWGAAAWVKRKFQRGGTSTGIKGEIKF